MKTTPSESISITFDKDKIAHMVAKQLMAKFPLEYAEARALAEAKLDEKASKA